MRRAVTAERVTSFMKALGASVKTPGRVFPGKKMSGHMGAVRQSTQRLEVVRVDAERGLIAIKGAVPGAPGGDVIVRPSSKV